jgi:hypothetical protein
VKTNNLEKTVQALHLLIDEHAKVLGNPREKNPEGKVVLYLNANNEKWISVLHDYLVWGTVKRVGQALSQLVEEPVMTAAYMNEELFELSFYEKGDLQAERIFCEEWTREEYGELKEERIEDDYLQQIVELGDEDFAGLIQITSPEQAVNKLSESVGMSLWCDAEWVPYEETIREQFTAYAF